MFDPERDEDRGRRPFYVRIAFVFVIGVAGGSALLPSVTGFEAGPDQTQACVAVIDGWHADRSQPATAGSSPADIEQANAFLAWENGPGHCVREGRHRLIITGVALVVLAVVVAGGRGLRRTRRRHRLVMT